MPEGNWFTWLVLSGRGFGKTRTATEAVREVVEQKRYGRIALLAETSADARDVLVEGESGILACSPAWNRPHYEPSKRRLTWPNGAMATLYNGTEPDQLRGPQHDFAVVDELAKYMHAQETWDQLMFGMRLGVDPRVIVTTTPRPIPIIRQLLGDSTTVVTRGKTTDNALNLPSKFLQAILGRYEGTRLGRQELDGEVVNDLAGGLWTKEVLDAALFRGELPDMKRIVVAVDPSGTQGSKKSFLDERTGDSVGIVVVGLGVDDFGYVLADRTCNLSPSQWGAEVVRAYKEFDADLVVAETNFGGAMVEHVVRSVSPLIPYKGIHASRGKVVRAEPIAALYEQRRVRHSHSLKQLEDQMMLMTSSGYMGEGSPDRVDALVWGLTSVALTPGLPRIKTGVMKGAR